MTTHAFRCITKIEQKYGNKHCITFISMRERERERERQRERDHVLYGFRYRLKDQNIYRKNT